MAKRTYLSESATVVATGAVGDVAAGGNERNPDVDEIEVTSLSGGHVFITVDGSAPTVEGDDTYVVQAGGSVRVDTSEVGSPVTVNAISSGAFVIGVEATG